MCQCHFDKMYSVRHRYNEAVKLARDPDVHNEELLRTFQRSFAGARKVNVVNKGGVGREHCFCEHCFFRTCLCVASHSKMLVFGR